MRRLLLFCVLSAASATLFAQTPPSGATAQGRQTTPATPTPTQQPRPATPAPQTPAPAPAPRRPAAPAPVARGGLIIFATDASGAGLRDVRVLAVGPTERSGTTDSGGRLTITGMQVGTYRLRFSSDAVVEFEKEVVVRGGTNIEVDVSLRPAPPPVVVTAPAPPPPPAPAPALAIGPIGEPQSINIQGLPDRDFIRNEPRKEMLVSCSANTRTTLVQMNQDQPARLYESAEVTHYVVAGEGTITVNGRDIAVEATSFVAVPRGTRYAITRKGRRPLIMVVQLSGEPCEQAR